MQNSIYRQEKILSSRKYNSEIESEDDNSSSSQDSIRSEDSDEEGGSLSSSGHLNNESGDDSIDNLSNHSGTEATKKTCRIGGRRSNEALKSSALMMSFFDVATSMALPCNITCCLGKRCCSQLKMETILNERVEFFNKIDELGKKNICIIH